MFLILLVVVLVAAGIHVAWGGGSRQRAGELLLLWVLVGYCGAPMIVVAVAGLARPDAMADILGFPPGNPFQTFLLVAYLGMSVLSVLALRYRGAYLIGPGVVWSVFFVGATWIHLHQPGHVGGHGNVLMILATHLLISVLLVAGLVMSGVLTSGRATTPAAPSVRG